MASQPTIEQARRTAWAVLAIMVAALMAWSIQATRRGWSPPLGEIAPVSVTASAMPAVARPATLPAPPASAELAAPASGTTGTIALPALPAMATAVPDPADRGVVAARPFALGRAAKIDRVRALECLTAAVYYEAASEPDAGQQAVAQVVLNRVRHPAFPSTVCGVVYQGSERAGCQFSFACDGSIARHVPSAAGWARAARVAVAALGGRVFAPVGLATHYHTFAVTPAWNRALVMTDAVGAHFFHRWKGWWGTAPAFRQLYAGGEPVPGPHPSLLSPTAVSLAPALALVAPPPPVTPAAAIQPAYRGSGTPRQALAASDDHLPPAATILPEWAESGRPLH